MILVSIACFDYKYKRIPNPFVLILFIVVLFEGRAISSLSYIITSTIGILLFAYFARCGMGDVKLSLVVINVLVGNARIVQYLWFLVAISTISVIIHLLRYRVIQGNFAFGPAICGAVLALRVVSNA